MSSKRRWTDLFKVDPSASNSQENDMNRGGPPQNEKRNSESKPRWNPKREQIDILESIFMSGNINPSREEIQLIRVRLQEFGEVGDANVFYWFQNRKSRNRKKQRRPDAATEKADGSSSSIHQPPHTIANATRPNPNQAIKQSTFPTLPASTTLFPTQNIPQTQQVSGDPHINLQNPVQTANQGQILGEGTAYPYKYNSAMSSLPLNYSQFLLPEETTYPVNPYQRHEAVISSAMTNTTVTRPDTRVRYGNEDSITVTIDEEKFNAPRGPVNLKAAFGPNVLMVDSSCRPILTDENGFSLEGLQDGATYYLLYKTEAAPITGYSQV